MPKTSSEASFTALLKRFAWLYLPVVVVLSSVLLAGIRQDQQSRLDSIQVREELRIKVARDRIAQDISDVYSDLRIIANLPLLQSYLNSGNPLQREELEKVFLVLSRETRRYDQIRYLDDNGQEVIRINHNDGKPVVVPRDQLQSKSGRYYFDDVFKLDRGEISVSPLDLNVEHDALEIPYKPTIRYGTPVFDSAGRKKGIVLLNYYGRELLQDFVVGMKGGTEHSSMLLNRDGYWLSSDNKDDEWGFMLGNKERTFAHDMPQVWRVISSAKKGSLSTDQGMFIYNTVYPPFDGGSVSPGSLRVVGQNRQEPANAARYWKIVSFVPRDVLAGSAFYNQPLGMLLLAAVYLTLALAAFLFARASLSRERAQDELRDSEERYRTLFESMDEGFCVVEMLYDRDGKPVDYRFVEINPAFEKQTGLQHALGKTIRELVPDHDTHWFEIYGEVARTGKSIRFENAAIAMRRYYDVFAFQIGGEGSQRVGILFKDISENKLSEQSLVAAKEKAELASRAKDSFLATMSHEIRTPLTGMLGMLELLSMTELDDKQHATLDAAWESGRGLLRIVSDILDWSKIEEGKLELSLRSTSIPQLLHEVVNTYSRVASAKNLVLWLHADARLSEAHIVDPLRLSQVLNNFVSNAIKFTQRGEIEVRAELLEQHESGERIRFSVKDTGVGIPGDVQKRLFQRYRQESSDTARMYGGTGLGLAICRRLAEMMDGQIELQSEPGNGATFSITLILPVSGAPGADISSLHPEVEQRAVTPLLKQSEDAPQILAVDDHPINRDLLARQIELLGLHAETAKNGLEALAKWQEGRFALVITDCHMPEMDGYEFARALRKIEAEEKRRHTPIIAWTANALAEEVEHCRLAGMDELLVKPTTMAQLKTALSKWLAIAESENSMSAQSDACSEQSAALIDYDELIKVVPDRAEHARILQEFQSHMRADFARLNGMFEQNDPVGVEQTAHRMKGSGRMVGARAMAVACADIEQAARSGKLDNAGEAVAQLRNALEQFEAYMQRKQRGGQNEHQ